MRTHFDLPWSMELGYDENELGGADESGLQSKYSDEESGRWLPVQTQVDAANNKVICKADHFTLVVLVAAAPQVGESSSHLYLPAVTR